MDGRYYVRTMQEAPWEIFFKEKIIKVLDECEEVIDIGGGLRIDISKSNRFDPRRAWITSLLKVGQYKTLDPVDDYKPDIVGDVHNLPIVDNSVEAILCLAVLEHVKDPFKAVSEIYRVLKPGGYCLIYVPFLYNYHPMKGYYDDYWRFTEDGARELFKDFKKIEITNLRGRFETLANLFPFGPFRQIVCRISKVLDRILNTDGSKHTAGFYLFVTK